jgi:hypothetical protein
MKVHVKRCRYRQNDAPQAIASTSQRMRDGLVDGSARLLLSRGALME